MYAAITFSGLPMIRVIGSGTVLVNKNGLAKTMKSHLEDTETD